MNTTLNLIRAAAAASVLIVATPALADDGSTTAQTVTVDTGGHSTEATDRGGKDGGTDYAATDIALLNWLRGLMD